jgi:hypothetical protein
LVGGCESGVCAIAPLDGSDSDRQINSERPLARKLVAAPLTTLFPDDVANTKPAAALASFAPIFMPHEIFDIAARNSDVSQAAIIETLQFRRQATFPPLPN